MRWVWVFLALTAVLLAGAAVYLWLAGDAFILGLHGMIAMVLGIVLTSAVTVALMALMFHSSRSGADDEAAGPPEDDRFR